MSITFANRRRYDVTWALAQMLPNFRNGARVIVCVKGALFVTLSNKT